MISEKVSFKKSKYGYYLIILAAALSALIHVISKPIFFTPVAKKTHSISKFGKKDWMFMGLIGMAEVAALITYFYGLSTASAVNASIFSNSEIIFALVIAMLVFKERLHIKESIPFTMIIIGMMVIPVGNDLFQNNFSLGHMVTGDLLIILSGVLYAVDITLCKYIGDRFDTKRVTQVLSFISAGVAVALIAAFQIPMNFDLAQLPGIITLSIFGTGLSTLFFLMALKFIGTVRTVLLYSTTAVFGVIFSGLFLSETISTMDIFSLGLVLVGIFLLRNKLAGKEHDEESESPSNATPKRKTRKQAKHTHKMSVENKVKNEIALQSWISAG
jgi:drug/metabolite transporter (DMT)-like permease